jgi:hypothetical protein
VGLTLVAVGGSAPWIQQQTEGVAYEECWMADSARKSRFEGFQGFKVSRKKGNARTSMVFATLKL